jgi:RNA polymerase sigma-70 factor, ECF subfamily
MNAETFKQVFLPYHQKLFRIAYRLVGNAECAEDMLQDSFIKLWEKREQLVQVANTEAFAIVTLKNTCLDYLRKQKEDFQLFEQDVPEAYSLPEQIEYHDEAQRVKQYLSRLPQSQQTVMKLKHWDGLTDEEIEQATGYSLGNIRVLLSRGRTSVREHFNKLR